MITEITVSVPRHLADVIVQARQVAEPDKFDQSLLAGIDAARTVADWTAIDAHPGDRRSVRLPVSKETLELIEHVNSFFALRSRARIVTAAVVAAQATRNGNVFATLAKQQAVRHCGSPQDAAESSLRRAQDVPLAKRLT